MVSSHRAYVHGLYTSHTAVILHLYACEIAQGVGHGVGIEALQFIAREYLSRYGFHIRPATGYSHFSQHIVNTVGRNRIGHRGPGRRNHGHCKKQ